MINIDKTNYGLYKKVFEVIWQHYSKLIEAEISARGLTFELPSPIETLNSLETKSKSLALKSLKSGFSDTLIRLKDAPNEFKIALDDDLKGNGLPGYFVLYAQLRDTLPSILKRQSILLIEEYYFVMEILNDTTSEITEDEREILNRCILAFELKHAERK